MKQTIRKFINNNSIRLYALVAAIASIAPVCCRGSWYQPEEPEGIEEFFKQKKNRCN